MKGHVIVLLPLPPARYSVFAIVRYTLLAAAVSAGLILLPIWQRAASAQYEVTPAPTPAPGPPPTVSRAVVDAGAVDAAPLADGAVSESAPAPPPPLDPAAVAAEATSDAKAYTTGETWFIVGCLFGLLGVLVASAIEPSPPVWRLMGQSEDYVVTYTTAYKSAARSIRVGKAATGCAVGVSLSFALLSALRSSR